MVLVSKVDYFPLWRSDETFSLAPPTFRNYSKITSHGCQVLRLCSEMGWHLCGLGNLSVFKIIRYSFNSYFPSFNLVDFQPLCEYCLQSLVEKQNRSSFVFSLTATYIKPGFVKAWSPGQQCLFSITWEMMDTHAFRPHPRLGYSDQSPYKPSR